MEGVLAGKEGRQDDGLQVVEVKRKIGILKEALLAERQATQ
jgi:hypothetical protein